MPNSFLRSRILLAACLLLTVFPHRAAADFYSITAIATTRDGFSSFGAFPAINASGTVAFQATRSDGSIGVFTGKGGVVTTVARTGDANGFGSFGDPSLNDAGTVAFLAGFAQGTGLFTASGGSVHLIVGNDLSSPLSGLGDPVLNNAGPLAFVGDVRGSAGPHQVLKGKAPPFVDVADNGGPIDGFVNNGVAINASGAVAFYARFKGPGSAVYVGSGGPLTTIADTTSLFDGFEESPTLNDAGTVAFVADLKAGGQGVYTGKGGSLTKVADAADGFQAFTRAWINNAEEVAFEASLTAGGSGIFTGGDPIADRVIGTGDALLGSTVAGTGRVALNDAGQVVFSARLSDGTLGVFVATPVPEPSSLLLASVGVISLLTFATRCQRPARVRRCSLLLLALAALALSLSATGAARADLVFTTFDPPGSTRTTFSVLNNSGTVAGTYRDATQGHGFIRTASGSITTIDPAALTAESPRSTTPARWRGITRGALTTTTTGSSGIRSGTSPLSTGLVASILTSPPSTAMAWWQETTRRPPIAISTGSSETLREPSAPSTPSAAGSLPSRPSTMPGPWRETISTGAIRTTVSSETPAATSPRSTCPIATSSA
jgi:hypothetical protein